LGEEAASRRRGRRAGRLPSRSGRPVPGKVKGRWRWLFPGMGVSPGPSPRSSPGNTSPTLTS